MKANAKDVAAGVLFVAIGLFFSIDSLLHLRLGEALDMGPGYFPLVMGMILIALGSVIALRAIGKTTESFGRVSWRGVALVAASILFFAFTVRGLGMAPSLFGSIVLAAHSSGLMNWRSSALVGVILSAFSVFVFVFLLGLPYPVIGEWLRR